MPYFRNPSTAVKSYSETFFGADSTDIGRNWVCQNFRGGVNDSWGSPNRNTNNLLLLHQGTSNTSNHPHILIPRMLTFTEDSQSQTGIWGKSQFVQARFRGGSANSAAGLIAWGIGDDALCQGYVFLTNVGSTNRIAWILGNAETSLLAGQPDLVDGDVIRIEVTRVGTTNTVTFIKNGVVLLSTVDTHVLAKGFPGFYQESTNNAGSTRWDNFSCGAL